LISMPPSMVPCATRAGVPEGSVTSKLSILKRPVLRLFTAIRKRLLAEASRHHGRWLVVNLVGVAVTAVLVLLPGPNLIGYYFAFRVVGHFLSWRGARQGLEVVSWRPNAEPILSELGGLAHLPREERAERVEALVAQLDLPRLAAFFDRVACPPR